jgi:Spy/CpxP family protein refolding chaperone
MKRISTYWLSNLLIAVALAASAFLAARAIGQNNTATKSDAPSSQEVSPADAPEDQAPPVRDDRMMERLREHARHRQERMRQWLGLTDEQADAVRRADPDFMQEVLLLKLQASRQRRALAEAFRDDTKAETEILALVDAVTETQAALQRRVVEHMLRVREHLTPEQRRRMFHMAAEGLSGTARGPRGPRHDGRPARPDDSDGVRPPGLGESNPDNPHPTRETLRRQWMPQQQRRSALPEPTSQPM